MIPLLSGTASDPSPHVRLALAKTVCSIAQSLYEELVVQSIVPIMRQLVQDECLEIKQELLRQILERFPEWSGQFFKRWVLPMLFEVKNEYSWRYKIELLDALPRFLKVLGYDAYLEVKQELFEYSLMSNYQAVRNEGIRQFGSYIGIFGYEKIRSTMVNQIKELSYDACYKYRVTSLQALGILKDELRAEDLDLLFSVRRGVDECVAAEHAADRRPDREREDQHVPGVRGVARAPERGREGGLRGAGEQAAQRQGRGRAAAGRQPVII